MTPTRFRVVRNQPDSATSPHARPAWSNSKGRPPFRLPSTSGAGRDRAGTQARCHQQVRACADVAGPTGPGAEAAGASAVDRSAAAWAGHGPRAAPGTGHRCEGADQRQDRRDPDGGRPRDARAPASRPSPHWLQDPAATPSPGAHGHGHPPGGGPSGNCWHQRSD